MTLRFTLAMAATIGVLALSLVYLGGTVLHTRTFEAKTTAVIHAPRTNGVHPGSAVMYRGIAIGTVGEVTYRGGDQVAITISYDDRYRIPVDTSLTIENQSLLGESAVVLIPDTDTQDGPAISSGQVLTASAADIPASVPELLGSVQTLLDQVSPNEVNELVDTLRTALAGTQGDIDRLTPAAQQVAATMIYSQPALVTILRNAAPMMQNGRWIGPALRPVRGELLTAGDHLRDVITHVKPFADFTDGGRLIGERWKPTLERSASMVGTMVPPIARLAETLIPAAQRAGHSIFAELDIATLLTQAMTALPGDSLKLNLTAPERKDRTPR